MYLYYVPIICTQCTSTYNNFQRGLDDVEQRSLVDHVQPAFVHLQFEARSLRRRCRCWRRRRRGWRRLGNGRSRIETPRRRKDKVLRKKGNQGSKSILRIVLFFNFAHIGKISFNFIFLLHNSMDKWQCQIMRIIWNHEKIA